MVRQVDRATVTVQQWYLQGNVFCEVFCGRRSSGAKVVLTFALVRRGQLFFVFAVHRIHKGQHLGNGLI